VRAADRVDGDRVAVDRAGALGLGPARCLGGAGDVSRFLWYYRLSRRLAITSLLAFVVLALFTAWLYGMLGPIRLRWLAVAVFVLAWIGQFIGHRFEGRRPSFFTDLQYLLVGPAWLMEKLLRRLHLAAGA